VGRVRPEIVPRLEKAGGVVGIQTLQVASSGDEKSSVADPVARLGESQASAACPDLGSENQQLVIWHFQAGTGGFPALGHNGETLTPLFARIACSRRRLRNGKFAGTAKNARSRTRAMEISELQMNYPRNGFNRNQINGPPRMASQPGRTSWPH